MKKRKKKLGGYLTVEAALVIPMVLGVVLFVIYFLFFQYDRCLMEQNTGILALRACTLQITEGEERVRQLVMQSKQPDERYLAWCMEDAVITVKGNRVKVERSGMLQCPFSGFLLLQDESNWECCSVFQNYRIQPVKFIRNYRKIIGGK